MKGMLSPLQREDSSLELGWSPIGAGSHGAHPLSVDTSAGSRKGGSCTQLWLCPQTSTRGTPIESSAASQVLISFKTFPVFQFWVLACPF